jgi:hypothetical protein
MRRIARIFLDESAHIRRIRHNPRITTDMADSCEFFPFESANIRRIRQIRGLSVSLWMS